MRISIAAVGSDTLVTDPQLSAIFPKKFRSRFGSPGPSTPKVERNMKFRDYVVTDCFIRDSAHRLANFYVTLSYCEVGGADLGGGLRVIR